MVLRLRQILEKCDGEQYLKMAPSDSPSKTALGTNLLGSPNLRFVTYRIWKGNKLNQLNVCNGRYIIYNEIWKSRFYRAVFDGESHGDLRFCSFGRRYTVVSKLLAPPARAL